MSSPNIKITEGGGKWFASFTPEGYKSQVIIGDSRDEVEQDALSWLDENAIPRVEAPEPNSRQAILKDAGRLTSVDRNGVYGDPRINHQRIAVIMTVLLDKKLAPGKTITAADAALLMVAVKLSRLVETPEHLDSFVDGAAYMAIAGELALKGAKK